MRSAIALLALAGAAIAPQAPAPAADSGMISGQVIDAGTGRPVSAALVSIAGSRLVANGPNAAPRILTAADGRFAFTHLSAPGTFTITAVKGGYSEGGVGMYRPNGTRQSVDLDAARKSADVVVRVWKLGAITGTVTDEAGEPVVGMQVRAVMRRAGVPQPFSGPTVSASTDDRGVYRIPSLLPGDYIVAGSPPGLSAPASVFADVSRTGRASGELVALVSGRAFGELGTGLSVQAVMVGDALYGTGRGTATPPPPVGTRMQIYPPTFHPGTTAPAQARIVSIASGEERASVDIHLAPVTTVRVSGMVIGPNGPVSMMGVRLNPAGAELVPPDALGALGVTNANGAFVFPAVPPGNYVLKTESRESATLGFLAMPIAAAGDDIDGVVATLQPPLKITGRTQFEGSAQPPANSGGGRVAPLFSLEPDDAGPVFIGAASTSPDGLTLSGFPAGRYRVRVAASPAGWMFKAAMLDGVDVSMTPFEFTRDVTDLTLVFTDRWSGVGGAVQGPRADRALVVLFPTDSRAWAAGPSPRRLLSARVDAQGRFAIRSVPPGDYYLAAIPDEQASDWREPSTLDALVRLATQVSIAEGEHKTFDLQLREVR